MVISETDIGKIFRCRVISYRPIAGLVAGSYIIWGLGEIYDTDTGLHTIKCHVSLGSYIYLNALNRLIKPFCSDFYVSLQSISTAITTHPLDTSPLPIVSAIVPIDNTGLDLTDDCLKRINFTAGQYPIFESKNNSDLTTWNSPKMSGMWNMTSFFDGAELPFGYVPENTVNTPIYEGTAINTFLASNRVRLNNLLTVSLYVKTSVYRTPTRIFKYVRCHHATPVFDFLRNAIIQETESNKSIPVTITDLDTSGVLNGYAEKNSPSYPANKYDSNGNFIDPPLTLTVAGSTGPSFRNSTGYYSTPDITSAGTYVYTALNTLDDYADSTLTTTITIVISATGSITSCDVAYAASGVGVVVEHSEYFMIHK